MREILKARITQTSNSEELINLAKSRGIILPSDYLGAFKTVYARLEDSNKNGVRLATDAVEKALQTLIGAQVNINHWRQNWTVGSIFWAKINKNDEIEVAFTFFKDVYPDEYELAMELFAKGELTVSFELTADQEAQEFHADGTRTLHDVHFVGCGLLLNETPAEPTAIVFESAKRQIKELVTLSTGDLVFAKSENINFDALKEVIRATLRPDDIKQDEQSQINPEIEGGSKLMEETKKKETLEEATEEVKAQSEESSEVESKETSDEQAQSYTCECLECGKKVESSEHCKDIKCPECGGEMRREDRPGEGANVDEKAEAESVKKDAEEKVEEEPKEESTEAKEEKSEEVTEEKPEVEEKAEDVSEEKAETESDEAKVEYKREVNQVVKETYDENETKVEADSEITETVVVDGKPAGKTVEKTKTEVVYTQAEVEAMRSDYETKIADLEEALKEKDSEIESAKETAIKVTELKAELGDYVADFKEEDFLNEDKVEIARLRKENDVLKTKDSKEEKVEEAQVEKEEVEASLEEKVDLDNGHEEIEAKDESTSLSDVIKNRMKETKEV